MKLIIYIILILTPITQGLAQDTTKVSLLFAGDIMGHGSQITSAYDPVSKKYDYTSCFQFVKPYLQAVDLAIANLELTLAGPPYTGYPQFSSPDALAHTLKDVGFDVLVTANNHSADRGQKGIERTISMLDTLDILHTGTFTNASSRIRNHPLFFNKNGINFSLLNYTFSTNGIAVPKPTLVNLIDTAQIRKDLGRSRKAKPDVTIVFMHWGIEYENLPSKQQRDIAEFCFNQGADLVIGAHPHVLQPMEWRKDKNKLVVYSLGNFVSGQRDRYKNGGAMAYVQVQKIRFKPDSMVTTIDSAGYYLEWVYRTDDSQKDYYILPVPSFEHDTTGFIKDIESQLSLKTFSDDSRFLYGRHTINVNEIRLPPADSLISYKVHIRNLPKANIKKDASSKNKSVLSDMPIDIFYGVERPTDNEPELVAGNFSTRFSADKFCQQLIVLGKDAYVVKYKNGVKQ